MNVPTLSPTGRAALAYATRFRWRVLPTKPSTKEPHGRFVRHGFLDATNDPEQVRLWWTADPDAGVAIACVTSGLVVVDVDFRNGGEDTLLELEQKFGSLPRTPTVLTPGGGEHFYYLDTVGAYAGRAGAGVDIKSAGYVLAPPTVHPNGGVYRWDVGVHPTDTPLAELPDAWLAHMTPEHLAAQPRPGMRAPVRPSSGIDAADSWLGRAFEAAGWMGRALPDGKRMVRCPWVDEHSDGRGDGADSSTILFPKATGHTLGGFRCAHAHCEGRTWRDVVAVLPNPAKWAADQATRAERNRLAVEQLERFRQGVA